MGTHLPEKRYLGSSLPPAIEVPDAGAGSWYAMGPLDDKGRATWVDAVLNKTDLSDAPRGKLDDPAGWESGLNYNRTHLGAHQLGFPPDPRNVTTAAREVNTFGNLPPAGVTDLRPPNMRAVEIQVAEALNAGQTVRYRVTPIYHGDAPMPVAYSMQVEGTGGPMKPLSIDTVIRGWTHHTK
ncbi:MAG: DNA/RNA non-specific endonuclease [Kofleriaceae bacterium]